MSSVSKPRYALKASFRSACLHSRDTRVYTLATTHLLCQAHRSASMSHHGAIVRVSVLQAAII